MDRRAFLGTLAGGLVAGAFVAEAQQTAKVCRIGLLGSSPPTAAEASARLWEALFKGLRELGYVEGQNIAFEGRWYGERTERLPALAAELVQLKVDVIVTGAAPAGEAAQRAKEAVPGLSRVVVLWNPSVASQALLLREADVAARALQVQLQVLEARAPSDFARAFSVMTKDRAGGLITLTSPMFFAERSRIVQQAAQSRLPTIYGTKEYAEAGGLMAYGPSLSANWRRAATYVDKILKGAKPGDLPIEQPAKLELIINLIWKDRRQAVA
jgi:putative ABC transport system substrate-binding protein